MGKCLRGLTVACGRAREVDATGDRPEHLRVVARHRSQPTTLLPAIPRTTGVGHRGTPIATVTVFDGKRLSYGF